MSKLRQAFASGLNAVMLYLPTGGGKTECSISLLDMARQKGNRSAMVMDRRILCDQTSARLTKYDIDHGVLMSGHWRYRPEKDIQICSVQTLEAREGFPAIKLMVVDEAHSSRKSINNFILKHPEIKVVGLSASPFTKGLGKIYQGVVCGATTKQLVELKQLVPLRVFISKEIDMEGVKKIGGEWSDGETTSRAIKITGDVVSEWVKKTHEIFGGPVKTIIFTAGVEHGIDLSRKFAEAGYNFISISYKDDNEYKDEVIKDFHRDDTEIHGILACDILTKGFDCPSVLMGVSARPFSKSYSSHVQQLGRVMRPNEGKEFAVWLDFSGNYLRFLDQWQDTYEVGVHSLDDKDKPVKEPKKSEKEAASCPRCHAVWPQDSDTCAHCGMVRTRKSKVEAVAGEMSELHGQKKDKYTSEYKEAFYHGLIGHLRQGGKNEGRAYHLYKEKFGVYPTWKKEAIEPTIEIMNWVHRANIKFAKSRK